MPLLAKVFHPILTSFPELPPLLSLMTKWGASCTHSRLRLLIWQGIAHTFSSWQPWKIYDSVDILPDIKVLVFTFNYQKSYFPEQKIPAICLSGTLFLISRSLINLGSKVVQHHMVPTKKNLIAFIWALACPYTKMCRRHRCLLRKIRAWAM